MATMSWITMLGVAGAAFAIKNVPPKMPNIYEDYTVSRLATVEPMADLAELKTTDNVIQLKRADAVSLSATYYHALRRQAAEALAANGSVNLVSAQYGQVFLAPITVGGQAFDMVVDSGSSDPWLVTSNFQCIDPYSGAPTDQAECYFGPPYSNNTATYSTLPNENFNISYAGGESLSGPMGYETFTLGGITVPHQQFGLVNRAEWSGDGISSGLVGFAYSTLTSAYAGTNPANDQSGATIPYNPLFTNMYTTQNVPAVFSLAISRDSATGGVLALGGLPNVPHSPYFATTPIVPLGVNTSSGQNVYQFYTIDVDGFAVSANQSAQFNVYPDTITTSTKPAIVDATRAIVDSGTSLFFAPDDVAARVAAAFIPAGTYDGDYGLYFVDCDAVAPLFGVTIARKIFYANPLDLNLQYSADQCISGVQRNFGGLTILGDVWMKSVVSVFDVGAGMMRFAAREFYGLGSYAEDTG